MILRSLVIVATPYVHIYIHICTCICIRMYLYIYICLYIYTHTHTRMVLCVYIRVYTEMQSSHVIFQISIYTYIYMVMYVWERVGITSILLQRVGITSILLQRVSITWVVPSASFVRDQCIPDVRASQDQACSHSVEHITATKLSLYRHCVADTGRHVCVYVWWHVCVYVWWHRALCCRHRTTIGQYAPVLPTQDNRWHVADTGQRANIPHHVQIMHI